MENRRIYTHGDLSFDPLAVMRALILESEGRVNEWIKEHNSVDPLVRMAAEQKLVDLARKVFSLPPFPDTTDGEVLALLSHFNGWLQGKD